MRLHLGAKQSPLDNVLQESTNKDPFEALGIPAFNLNLDEPKKKPRVKLNSIEDLPRFIESGQYNNEAGMKLITKFLSEDDQDLKSMGGVYDETGLDGVDDKEEPYPDGSEERNQQRARSAAMLYIKQGEPTTNYEPYGETQDKEKIDGWLIYQVLLMNPKGEHKLVKVCVPKRTDIVICFGMEETDVCADRVQTAYDLTEKGKAYYKKAGFEKYAPSYSKEPENKVQIKTPPIPAPVNNTQIDPVVSSSVIVPSTPVTPAEPIKGETEEDKQIRELQEKMNQLAEQKKKRLEEEQKKKQLQQQQSTPAIPTSEHEAKLEAEVSDLKKELEELKAAMKIQVNQNKFSEESRFKQIYKEKDQQSAQGIAGLVNQRIQTMNSSK